MASTIQFVVDGAVQTPDQAVLAEVGDQVVSNVFNPGGVDRVRWTMIAVPSGSNVPLGLYGLNKTGTVFTVDERGGYLIEMLATLRSGEVVRVRKAVLVPEESGKIIPPFSAEPRDLNLDGQTEGWHPFLEAWLQYIESASGGVGGVPGARQVIAGNGLQGGGNLTLDRSFSVKPANTTIVVNAGGVGVGVIGDTNHGSLSGGALHALASGSVAGFMSAADKTKLSAMPASLVSPGLVAPVAAANADGVSSFLARADHAHAHGSQAGGALHALASTSVAGFLSAADKVRLDGLKTVKSPISRSENLGTLAITSSTFVDVVPALSLGSLVVGDVISASGMLARAGATADNVCLEITSSATVNVGTVYSTILVACAGAANGGGAHLSDLFTVATPGAYFVHFKAMRSATNYDVSNRRLTAHVLSPTA